MTKTVRKGDHGGVRRPPPTLRPRCALNRSSDHSDLTAPRKCPFATCQGPEASTALKTAALKSRLEIAAPAGCAAASGRADSSGTQQIAAIRALRGTIGCKLGELGEYYRGVSDQFLNRAWRRAAVIHKPTQHKLIRADVNHVGVWISQGGIPVGFVVDLTDSEI